VSGSGLIKHEQTVTLSSDKAYITDVISVTVIVERPKAPLTARQVAAFQKVVAAADTYAELLRS